MSGVGLDMSLDDIIKKNKESNSRGGGRTRPSGGPAPSRRFNNRVSNRSAPYSAPKAPESAWTHDMFGATNQGPVNARPSSIETGTKLYISNLDYGVSNEDIKELFGEVGDLKKYAVHYDRSGRSKGTAEVVYARRQDAASAVKRYNNVQLDGKAMKLEIVGTNIATPAAGPPAANNFSGSTNRAPIGGQGRNDGFRRPRGGAGRGRGFGGRGRGRGRGRNENLSLEDLNADLDKYYAESSREAMQS